MNKNNNSLISNAIKLEQSGEVRKALDLLYKIIDELIQNNNFKDCDEFIKDLDVNELNTHLLIGIFTITAPYANQLHNREDLFARVQSRLSGLTPERINKLTLNLK